MVAGNEVNKRRFARARLSDEGDGLALLDMEVDVVEHLALSVVGERDMVETDVALEAAYVGGVGTLLDVVLGTEDFVDTLHRGHAFLDAVAGLRKVLQRLERGVENDEVVDELGRIDGRITGKDEVAAKPQHNDNHAGAQKFAHRMGGALADGYLHRRFAVLVVDGHKTAFHLALCNECLDDAQAAERLLKLAESVAPLRLGIEGVALERLAYAANTDGHDGHDDQGEQRELPTQIDERADIDEQEDGVLDDHVERRADRGVHFVDVGRDARQDVAFALFGEEGQRQRQHLAVEVGTDVAHNAGADGHKRGRTCEVGAGLQQRHDGQADAKQQHGGGGTVVGNEFL